MRAVVQRVSSARVRVAGRLVGAIGEGLVIFLGVGREDRLEDCAYLAQKIVHLRIFEDELGKMNKSVLEVGGELLVVSQFTLYGDCRKGRRPGFSDAARPEIAIPLYNKAIEMIKSKNISIEVGVFGADMLVDIQNDGPVTILLESSKLF